MTSIWLRDLAFYGLQVVLLVGSGALLARLFRLRASILTLVYWQALLALCLILPVCQHWKAAPATSPQILAGSTATVGAILPDLAAPAHVPQSRPWPIEQVVLLIIVGGIVMRGLWLATGFGRLARLRRDSVGAPAAVEPVLAAARQEVGAHAEFRISKSAPTPITFGLRRPIVLLPAGLGSMGAETQRAIVCHELIHVRRRDWTWCLAEEFVRTLLWFHPAIWWLIERIHLTREQLVDQAVIELTASRERYVEALLHVAQLKIEPKLIPAPLFLRRGLLKKRVAEILKETTMTTRRLILCLAVSAGALFLVARAATSIFPLRVHAQEFSSAPIQVVQGNENLLDRAALVYPRRAIERRVEGDVVLDLSVDEQGQVSDAHVLSGPEELRRACLQSVLEWRYQPSKSAPASTQVMIHFQLPAEGASPEFVLPAAPRESEDARVRYFVMSNPEGAAAAERKMKELEEKIQSPDATAEDKANYEVQLAKMKADIGDGPETRVVDPGQLEPEAEELKAKIADAGTPPEDRAKLKKELAERLAEIARDSPQVQLDVPARDAGAIYFVTGNDGEEPVNGKLTRIRSERVPQATLDAMLPRLGVHVGDNITEETAKRAAETVWSFDKNYKAIFRPDGEGGLEFVIVAP